MTPPTTLHDWSEALDARDTATCSRATRDAQWWQALSEGNAEPAWSAVAMNLVARFVERQISKLDQRLMINLDEYAADAGSVALAVERYAQAARRLLFFTQVRGLPAGDTAILARELGAHVRQVFTQLARDAVAEDVAYVVLRAARVWERTEETLPEEQRTA